MQEATFTSIKDRWEACQAEASKRSNAVQPSEESVVATQSNAISSSPRKWQSKRVVGPAESSSPHQQKAPNLPCTPATSSMLQKQASHIPSVARTWTDSTSSTTPRKWQSKRMDPVESCSQPEQKAPILPCTSATSSILLQKPALDIPLAQPDFTTSRSPRKWQPKRMDPAESCPQDQRAPILPCTSATSSISLQKTDSDIRSVARAQLNGHNFELKRVQSSSDSASIGSLSTRPSLSTSGTVRFSRDTGKTDGSVADCSIQSITNQNKSDAKTRMEYYINAYAKKARTLSSEGSKLHQESTAVPVLRNGRSSMSSLPRSKSVDGMAALSNGRKSLDSRITAEAGRNWRKLDSSLNESTSKETGTSSRSHVTWNVSQHAPFLSINSLGTIPRRRTIDLPGIKDNVEDDSQSIKSPNMSSIVYPSTKPVEQKDTTKASRPDVASKGSISMQPASLPISVVVSNLEKAAKVADSKHSVKSPKILSASVTNGSPTISSVPKWKQAICVDTTRLDEPRPSLGEMNQRKPATRASGDESSHGHDARKRKMDVELNFQSLKNNLRKVDPPTEEKWKYKAKGTDDEAPNGQLTSFSSAKSQDTIQSKATTPKAITVFEIAKKVTSEASTTKNMWRDPATRPTSVESTENPPPFKSDVVVTARKRSTSFDQMKSTQPPPRSDQKNEQGSSTSSFRRPSKNQELEALRSLGLTKKVTLSNSVMNASLSSSRDENNPSGELSVKALAKSFSAKAIISSPTINRTLLGSPPAENDNLVPASDNPPGAFACPSTDPPKVSIAVDFDQVRKSLKSPSRKFNVAAGPGPDKDTTESRDLLTKKPGPYAKSSRQEELAQERSLGLTKTSSLTPTAGAAKPKRASSSSNRNKTFFVRSDSRNERGQGSELAIHLAKIRSRSTGGRTLARHGSLASEPIPSSSNSSNRSDALSITAIFNDFDGSRSVGSHRPSSSARWERQSPSNYTSRSLDTALNEDLLPAMSTDSESTTENETDVDQSSSDNRYIQISLSSGGVAEKYEPNIVVSPTAESTDGSEDLLTLSPSESPAGEYEKRESRGKKSREPFKGAKRFFFGKKKANS
jgi:hypothetical protein